MYSAYVNSSIQVTDKQKNYINKLLASDVPVDVRPLNPAQYLRTSESAADPKMCVWIKAKGTIGKLKIYCNWSSV